MQCPECELVERNPDRVVECDAGMGKTVKMCDGCAVFCRPLQEYVTPDNHFTLNGGYCQCDHEEYDSEEADWQTD